MMRSLSALSTTALFPSSLTSTTCRGSASCSRLTAAPVATGGICSISVGSGVFSSTLAYQMPHPCSRRRTSTMVHVRRNLAKIATTCYAKGITMSLGTSIFGLIVYGGVCPDSGVILENALEGTSDNTPNTHSWSGSVGTMGRTRGGEHVTTNDMFKASEINRRTAEAVKREKDKKGWVDYHHRCEAALPILDRLENEMKNGVGWLTSKELETLLRWKGVSVSKKGERCEQTHTVPTICRGRIGRGE